MPCSTLGPLDGPSVRFAGETTTPSTARRLAAPHRDRRHRCRAPASTCTRCTPAVRGGSGPRPTEEEDAGNHRETFAWAPAPRIHAAEGVAALVATLGVACDEELRNHLERLARDPVAAVRRQVAQNSCALQQVPALRQTLLADGRRRTSSYENCPKRSPNPASIALVQRPISSVLHQGPRPPA